MFAILFEVPAFLATVVLVVVLIGDALVRWTPLGVRLRQYQNRRRLEARAALTCPIHGYHSPESLVRLNSGEALCSRSSVNEGPAILPTSTDSVLGRLAVAGAVVLLLLLAAPACLTYFSPGNVGIVIHRAGGGGDARALGAGLHAKNPLSTSIEEYPTVMQTLVLARASTEGSTNNDEMNVSSVAGQPLSLDVSMSFELDPAKAPELYSTFRTDIGTIQHEYVKQAIRQALREVVGGEPTADIIGPKKAEVVGRVEGLLTMRLAESGIQVRQFTLNALRAPDAVMQASNQKNVMSQQAPTAQTELMKNQYQVRGDPIKAMGRAKAILAEAAVAGRPPGAGCGVGGRNLTCMRNAYNVSP